MLKGENYNNQLYESFASRFAINTMINGECGIIDNYGDKMAVTYNGNAITISSGFAVIKGGLIIETTYETLNVALENNMYHRLVLEVDLSQTNTREQFNQGKFKILSESGSYPSITQDDISLTPNSGIYQMELAKFQTTNSSIINFQDTRKTLSYNSLIQELRDAISRVIQGEITVNDIGWEQNTSLKEKIDSMDTAIVNTGKTVSNLDTKVNNRGILSITQHTVDLECMGKGPGSKAFQYAYSQTVGGFYPVAIIGWTRPAVTANLGVEIESVRIDQCSHNLVKGVIDFHGNDHQNVRNAGQFTFKIMWMSASGTR